MNVLSFKEVLEEAAYALGLDPQSNLQENVAAALCRYIEKRVRIGWQFLDWPELCRTEQRQFRPSWEAGVAYAAGDEVYDPGTDRYYVAIQANENAAVTDLAAWKPTVELDRYVALKQPGCTEIGDPLGAYKRKPALAHNPEEIPFFRSENGLQFDPGTPNRPWIKFRLPTPRFSTVRVDRNVPGQKGNVFYDPEDGNCYILSSVIVDWPPSIVGVNAEVQSIPAFLKDYVVAGVLADSLREDGQHDKATAQETVAEELLQDEGSQFNNQQRQTRRYTMRVR